METQRKDVKNLLYSRRLLTMMVKALHRGSGDSPLRHVSSFRRQSMEQSAVNRHRRSNFVFFLPSGVTPIRQGWTNARGLRGLGAPSLTLFFLYILIFQVLGDSHLFHSTADFFVNVS